MIPEAKGKKLFEKGQMAKPSLPAQHLEVCEAEREKSDAGAPNNLLPVCIVFSVGKLKQFQVLLNINRISNPQRGIRHWLFLKV